MYATIAQKTLKASKSYRRWSGPRTPSKRLASPIFKADLRLNEMSSSKRLDLKDTPCKLNQATFCSTPVNISTSDTLFTPDRSSILSPCSPNTSAPSESSSFSYTRKTPIINYIKNSQYQWAFECLIKESQAAKKAFMNVAKSMINNEIKDACNSKSDTNISSLSVDIDLDSMSTSMSVFI